MRSHTSPFRPVVLVHLIAIFLGCASSGEGPPHVTRSEAIPWVDVRTAAGYNWSNATKQMPEQVDRIDRVLRNRAVFRREGIGFGHLMLAPGALYPYHAHATPEAYHVLSGEAEWSVDGETRRVGPGTTIYHAPYAKHRWVTTSEEPLRVVWAQWAPDGDRSGLLADRVRRRGGAMTGDFFAGERRSRSVLPTQLAAPVESPAPESVLDRMRLAHLAAKSLEPVRPPIRAFVDAVGVPWNTELAGIRWRPVFGTPDFEWGHLIAIGPQARTIPAPAAPGLLHVLSGRVALRVDGDGPIGATAGTTVAIAPGERVEIDFGDRPSSAPPLHAIWIRWAPEADLGYWARDYFLTEPVPENGDSPSLRRDIEFFPSEDEAHRP